MNNGRVNIMRKTIFILGLCLLSLSSISSMAQTSTITSSPGHDSAFATNQPPAGALQLKDGADLSEIRFDDSPSYESIAMMLSLLFGVPTIIVAYCRAWILHRRGNPIIRCRRALQLASLLILATGILHVVLRIASHVDIMLTASLPESESRFMLLLNISITFKQFAVSLIAATVGMVAILLLPFDQKKST